jgi:archaeal flagellin FlaB
MHYLSRKLQALVREQRGITGLETAIVLIAFVVVSSVFSFAALSTGLFSSDKAKETIQAGLAETRGTMELRGAVIAEDTDTNGSIDKVYFQVSNAAGGQPIDLTPGQTVVRYVDASQSVMFDSGDFTVTAQGNADADYLLEPGEMYQISLNGMEAKLTPDLTKSITFVVHVLPPKGAVLYVERTTPVGIEKYNDLN